MYPRNTLGLFPRLCVATLALSLGKLLIDYYEAGYDRGHSDGHADGWLGGVDRGVRQGAQMAREHLDPLPDAEQD